MRFSNEDHRALLLGEIDADEYVRRVKADVDARLGLFAPGRVVPGRYQGGTTVDRTAVDCLISELRDEFEFGGLTLARFEERVAQFKEEIAADRQASEASARPSQFEGAQPEEGSGGAVSREGET